MTIDKQQLNRDEILEFLRRKADFLEGFANALRGRSRKWLLNQVVDMRRLLNQLGESDARNETV